MLTRTGSRLCQPPTSSERTSKISRAKNVLASHSAPYVVSRRDRPTSCPRVRPHRPPTRHSDSPMRPPAAYRMCPTNAPWPNVEPSCADCRRSWRPQHTHTHLTHTQLAQHAAHSHTPKNAVSQRTASDRSCPYVHVRRTRKRRASQSSSSSHITGRARNETVLFAARESGRLPGVGLARAHALTPPHPPPPTLRRLAITRRR